MNTYIIKPETEYDRHVARYQEWHIFKRTGAFPSESPYYAVSPYSLKKIDGNSIEDVRIEIILR